MTQTQIGTINRFFKLDATLGMKFNGFHKTLPIDMILLGTIKPMPKKELDE